MYLCAIISKIIYTNVYLLHVLSYKKFGSNLLSSLSAFLPKNIAVFYEYVRLTLFTLHPL